MGNALVVGNSVIPGLSANRTLLPLSLEPNSVLTEPRNLHLLRDAFLLCIANRETAQRKSGL
jgi:hypothetical protein